MYSATRWSGASKQAKRRTARLSALSHHAAIICATAEHSRSNKAVLSDSPNWLFREFILDLRTVDYAVKIRVNPQQTGVDLNVKHSMVRITRHLVFFLLNRINIIARTRSMRLVFYFPRSPVPGNNRKTHGMHDIH